VAKKAEMRNEELLESDGSEDDGDDGIWGSITKTFTGNALSASSVSKGGEDDDTLNIFCLASGKNNVKWTDASSVSRPNDLNC
jgi:hypothetical protein